MRFLHFRAATATAVTGLLAPVALGGYLFAVGCGDNLKGRSGSSVQGVEDMHCVDTSGQPIANPTDLTKCMYTPPPDAPVDAGPPSDTLPAPDATPAPEFGATQYNQMGDDDDCKYHMMWTAPDGVYQNTDLTFHLSLTDLVDGKGVTGADPRIEAFLDDTHAAPTTNQTATDQGGGEYDIGPVRFDRSGRWTIRFHVFEKCFDLIDVSPHGHAAFFLDVP
jgi:hypothetical protein